ncbi:DNA translocase FtsK [Mucilaginibacter gotjawali]|uniref:DNA segregation ATPase FtsK/SpoIIIE-like protein n=2 Tax=Mucilaginibacter gotjawali TaxID=1550579 RepID=A0A839SB32_9SPHI|nr:DNA translocase FtsK [Mucilaginibacter gotjawali]MBB3053797.1 DNA segregation ATPase FtsK/SpoIIIE-like protein [Mucilaginibacter gotjawali]BAU54060.1 DNA translocase FtsK [Mucilaginibacter gotjawali]
MPSNRHSPDHFYPKTFRKNITTGSIKANFSSRLAFRLVSSTDSRTILDVQGADLLQGQGHMLHSNGVEIMRLQGALLTGREVESVCDFIGLQRGYPSAMLLPAYGNHYTSAKEFDPDNLDPMFDEAASLIVLHQQGSTSLIRHKMKLGYNRSGHIIDQLERAGIVGPFEGSKARDVLFSDDYSLERHLEAIRKKGP